MDIKKVLVAVDFSPPSTLAASHGIALARKFHAKLALLHVIESPAALLYTIPVGAETIERQRTAQAERMLPALIAPEDQDDLDVEFLLKTGDVAQEIESAIREQRPDILVIGTHGRSLWGRLFIGSVAQSLLRELAVPVLTVCHVSRPLEFKRILLATDFTDMSDEAFRFALELAKTTASELIVTHVVDTRPHIFEGPDVEAVFEEERQSAAKEAQGRFAEFEAEASLRGVRLETVLAEGVPSEAIVRIAEQHMVDFIVLQVRKRSRIDLVLLGDTAEHVIREARVPVLSVPLGVASRLSFKASTTAKDS